MASKIAPSKTTASPARALPPALIAALTARFNAALLPAEATDFHGADLAEAARFTLAAR